MPGGRTRSDDDQVRGELSPYQALLAAMFRTAVQDARSQGRSSRDALRRRASAQAWLRNEPLVQWWLTLAGLPEWTYTALLREAGLLEDACNEKSVAPLIL